MVSNIADAASNAMKLLNPISMVSTMKNMISSELSDLKTDALNTAAFVIDDQLDNYNHKKFVKEQKAEISDIKQSMTGDGSISDDDRAIAVIRPQADKFPERTEAEAVPYRTS